MPRTQEMFDLSCGAVAKPNPDDLRRSSGEDTAVEEVGILRHDRQSVQAGVAPDCPIPGPAQSCRQNVLRSRIKVVQRRNQGLRKILVEEQLHAAIVSNLRSRSAANARQARMSLSVSCAKSANISAYVIPDARYSSTSPTVILVPRMQGLPLRFPSSSVMISE